MVYTALNRKEILIHAIRWILKKLTVTDEEIKVTDEFEIMLSEISQTQKHLYFMISPLWGT